MHKPRPVRGRQAVRGLRDHVEREDGIRRAVGEQVGQGGAVDELHHQVGGSAWPGVAEVVDLGDPRVAQRARVPGLLAEPLKRVRMVGVLGAQHLDRYGPFEQQVGRPPHLADAPGRDLLVQAVAIVE